MVIPTRTDAPLALLAGRSFYGELLRAGVEIFEYDHGVLHSKLMTVDDRWCVASSANMDVRSFRLNFEISAVMYDETVAAPLARRIEGNCAASREIRQVDLEKHPWHRQVLEGVARLFSPLL
jgi:cardiolipin synthase